MKLKPIFLLLLAGCATAPPPEPAPTDGLRITRWAAAC